MSLFTLCGVALVCACAILLIKENGYVRYALVLSSLGLIIAAAATVDKIGAAYEKISAYLTASQISSYATVIFKAFGISFICELASDTLGELGSDRIGKWVELAGKAEILLLTVPLLNDLLDRAVSLL